MFTLSWRKFLALLSGLSSQSVFWAALRLPADRKKKYASKDDVIAFFKNKR